MKNLIFKTFLLLAFVMVSFIGKAQNYFNLVLNNSTSCSYTVYVYGGSPSTLLFTGTVGAVDSVTYNCSNGIPLNITIEDNTLCTFGIAPKQIPQVSCSTCSGCCMITSLFDSDISGPSGPPPGGCGTLGFLYIQTININ